MTPGPLFADDRDEAAAEPDRPPRAHEEGAPDRDPRRVSDHDAAPDARPSGDVAARTDEHASGRGRRSRFAEVLAAVRAPSTSGAGAPSDGDEVETETALTPRPPRQPSAPILDPSARLRVGEAYRIRNGRYEPDTWWTRLCAQLSVLSKSEPERQMDDVDAALKRLRTRGVRTGHLVAVGSAKGGTGKDSIAITLADVIAAALRVPTLVWDGDWDFGTLGERAPEEGRSSGTVLDVYEHRDELVSPAQLGRFVSRMPSGCHLLSAPRDPEDMEKLEVKHYAETVEVLRRFYPVIFVTMAPGVLAEICKWAFGVADQIVFVTDSRLVTADQAMRALPLLRKRHPDVPLTLVVNQAPDRPTEPQRRVIEIQLDNGVSDRSLLVPYNTRLEQQLDSGTLDLDDPDLPAATRIALKQATLAVAEGLG